MSDARIRVLVVDDSAFARKVIRDVLSRSPELEVVGTATDGLHALEQVSLLMPDVLTLDLVMPNLDGVGFLKALPKPNAPRVVIVSKSDGQSELVLAALEAGAVDVVQKPTALATDQLYELGAELVEKVKVAAGAAPQMAERVPRNPPKATPAKSKTELVVVGASTGGPQALTRFLTKLPADYGAAMAIVLHIPVGYTKAVAERLDEVCLLDVREAEDGMELRPGLVLLGRAGLHFRVKRTAGRLVAELTAEPSDTAHRPSVDVLFASAAEEVGPSAIGVVLTGMGDDGLDGARKIHAAGGILLTESRASCVVYGMPRVVMEAGFSREQPDIDSMAAALARLS